MKKLLAPLLCAVAALALIAPPPASASFGFREVDVTFNNQDGSVDTQAGSHPFSVTTTQFFNTTPSVEYDFQVPDEDIRDLEVPQIPGLTGKPGVVPRCTTAEFLRKPLACPASSQLGYTNVTYGEPDNTERYPVYSLTPPPGVPVKIGFIIAGFVPVTVELGLNESPPYNVVASLANIPNVQPLFGSSLTLWGVPAAKSHDAERCNGGCSVNIAEEPFLTVPRACNGPLETNWIGDSWQTPGVFDHASSLTHDDSEVPSPQGFTGCGKLGFSPSIQAQPTTKAATSPTGLDFSLNINDEGLTSPTGLAQSDIKKAVVTLPEGMSVNASIAEGLEVCTPAQLQRETVKSAPGAGCPDASKIGTVEVESPLIDETVTGALYQAQQDDPATTTPGAENPFDSLIALYLVIKNPTLGLIVKQPMLVKPDPVTGRLTTIADNLPQVPYSHFKLHFREGARSPLASPPACGTYNAEAKLTPWAGGAPVTTTSAFQIISGPESRPCPTGGLPPFKPGLVAGTLNNAAGRFSPFNVRLSRNDSEQEITHFSIKLPPGIAGILANVPYCPDAAIEAAKSKTGSEEIANPSCPKASEIGHTLVGAGVGSALAYAPGKLYLAGPYKGTSFSLAAITAARVGPFDLGTVVVRQGFKVDRETAEVFIDATESDPIPHIIDGVPVHLRDIRAYVDRSKFVFNPTSCERTSTASTLLGSGLDFGSAADDRPVTVSTPFQAADCAALDFKPKLALKLQGSTKRGGHPAFKATLAMHGGPGGGEANTAKAQVTLPRSEFLENAHIKTICTRVQFRAEKCPAESIYGKVSATTPVLSEPLSGPVYLRSSEHQLPDLVATLHSQKITVDLVGRIDSLNGRIRNTFEAVPDAPVSTFTLTMQGGKKGLLVNSTNLCKGAHKAIADFTAHNGKVANLRPELQAKCGKARKAKAHKRKAG